MLPPATSHRLLLRIPKDHPKVCLKKTELTDPGGGDMHPTGKDLWLAPQDTSGEAGKCSQRDLVWSPTGLV